MALPAFPNINQKVLQDGYSETPETNQAKFQPDVGPPLLRMRTSIAQTIFTIKQWLSSSDWDTLRSFYYTTLLNGTQQFTWVHPRTGVAATFQFEGPAPKLVGTFGITFEIAYTLRQIA